jgi:hypothetical protein
MIGEMVSYLKMRRQCKNSSFAYVHHPTFCSQDYITIRISESYLAQDFVAAAVE